MTSCIFDLSIEHWAMAPRTGAGSLDWTTASVQQWVCLGALQDLITEAVAGKATWGHYSDVTTSTHELTATGGYTVGGMQLAVITAATATTVCKFDATDSAWTGATFSAYGAITKGGNAITTATAPLITCHDFGGVQAVIAGTLTLQWASSPYPAVFTITVAAAA